MSELCGLSMEPTNIFGSTNFDVLKMDGIDDPMMNVQKIITADLEESYYITTLKFISEMDNSYTDAKINLYKNISEAANTVVVLESFSDFFSMVKNIIIKFLKFIKSLFTRFINALASIVGSDSYLNKHKKDLDKFKAADDFTINGYEFTFSPMVPASKAVLSIAPDLFADITADSNGALTLAYLQGFNSSVDYNEEYNKFRAKILNRDGESIDYSDYSEELFKTYRNGELDSSNIDVDSSYIIKCKNRYFKYNEMKKEVERQEKDIHNAYDKILKYVKEITKSNGNLNAASVLQLFKDRTGIKSIDDNSLDNTGYTMSGEMMAQIDVYIKHKCDLVQEISNIHALAFSAKLDAMKECLKQDRATLYTALSKVMRTDNARKD